MRLSVGGRDVPLPARFGLGPLVAYLGLNPAPIERHLLATTLFEDEPVERSLTRLRRLLFELAGLPLPVRMVRTSRTHLSWNPELPRTVDALELLAIPIEDDVEVCRRHLDRIEVLYRGPILAGTAGAWIEAPRQALDAHIAEVVRAIAARSASDRKIFARCRGLLERLGLDAPLPPRLSRPLTPASPILVGRDAEFRMLEGAWRAASGGAPQVVLVVGEAGIGKTRLVEAFVEQVAALDGAAALATCPALDQPLELQPLGAWLDHLPLDGLPDARQRVLSAFQEGSDTGSPDPRDRRRHLFQAVRALVAATAPVVLVADDAHWIDHETIELFDYLLTMFQPAPGRASLVILLAARDAEMSEEARLTGFLDRVVARGNLVEVRLHGLDAHALGAIARVASKEPLAPSTLERLIIDAEGNPLLIQQLAGALATGDAEEGFDRAFRVRIAQLSAAQRELAEVIAVLSEDNVSPDVVAGMVERPIASVLEDLDVMHRRGVLRVAEDGAVALSHRRMADSLYRTLRVTRRWSLHIRAAECLDQAAAADPSRGRRVAQHLAHAGKTGSAAERLVIEGERALARHAIRTADELFAQARALLDGQDAALELRWRALLGHFHTFDLLERLAEREHVLGALEALARAHPDPQRHVALLMRRTHVDSTRTRMDGVLRNARATMIAALEVDDEDFFGLAAGYFGVGHFVRFGLGLGSPAFAFWRDTPELDLIRLIAPKLAASGSEPQTPEATIALSLLGAVYAVANPEEGRAWLEKAIRIAHASGAERMEVYGLATAALAALDRGDLDAVQATLGRIESRLDDADFLADSGHIAVAEGLILQHCGRLRAAVAAHARAIDLAQRFQAAAYQVMAALAAAELHRWLGESDLARSFLEVAEAAGPVLPELEARKAMMAARLSPRALQGDFILRAREYIARARVMLADEARDELVSSEVGERVLTRLEGELAVVSVDVASLERLLRTVRADHLPETALAARLTLVEHALAKGDEARASELAAPLLGASLDLLRHHSTGPIHPLLLVAEATVSSAPDRARAELLRVAPLISLDNIAETPLGARWRAL